jgi:flagellar hook assembly protein FlgD
VILDQNYPNPFNPETTISYSLPKNGDVSLSIYNTRGQLVKTLVNESKTIGTHRIVWIGDDNHGNKVSSGIYFTRMVTEGKSLTSKMLMLK